MRAGEAWIQARLAGSPERLIREMTRALPVDPVADEEALAEGALRLYADVVRGDGGREDALPLLAADALLTHAFQACAERDPEALPDFAERWGGAGRLGEVVR